MRSIKLVFLAIISFVVLAAGTIDLSELFNYSNVEIPEYVDPEGFIDNMPANNMMDDKIATLGRVLFYDKKLSTNNTTSCASCHKQNLAFADSPVASQGANGLTKRHSMRLSHIRFASSFGTGFFWDGRAGSLEELATMPIQDHLEMGYSGENGDPSLQDLIDELGQVDYYQTLFEFAYGDNVITETRMQRALAQFMRSMSSFDSRYDEGRAQVENDLEPFPNFTATENQGKQLFFALQEIDPNTGERIGGGLSCGDSCHGQMNGNFGFANTDNANNGKITEIDGSEVLDIFKAPSLRDLFNANGALQAPLFHDGSAMTFNQVLDHYNEVPNTENLDPRLRTTLDDGTIAPQRLNITPEERMQVTAFMKTLTSTDLYTDEKLSNPFGENDILDLSTVGILEATQSIEISVFPNPASHRFLVKLPTDDLYNLSLYNLNGQSVLKTQMSMGQFVDVSGIASGLYTVQVHKKTDPQVAYHQKLVVR